MPLEKRPANPAPWPPLPKNDPTGKGRYPEPYPIGGDPKESFWTIADKAQVNVTDLVAYNFLTNKPEEINWYLNNYVGCTVPTRDGKNYTFGGAPKFKAGQTKGAIYIPRQAAVVFQEAPPIVVPRKQAGQIRWIQLTRQSRNGGGPNYMIPGVDQSSTPVSSKLEGNLNHNECKAQAMAALANFVARTGSSLLTDMSVDNRLKSLEAPFLKGGAGVADRLQPLGPHEAVVVMLRRTQNTLEPDFPKLPYGQPEVIGYGDLAKAGDIVQGFWEQPRLMASPGTKNYDFIYEYYVGTRLGPS